MAGAATLGLEISLRIKRLLVILENDGCFADGIEAATDCSVGHRTLRVEDYGKIAATFVDAENGIAVRVTPQLNVRQRAYDYSPGEKRHYFSQLLAYQVMPDEALLNFESVQLVTPAEQIISKAGVRVICSTCGEEIINQREVMLGGNIICRACAGAAYYRLVLKATPSPLDLEPTQVGIPILV